MIMSVVEGKKYFFFSFVCELLFVTISLLGEKVDLD